MAPREFRLSLRAFGLASVVFFVLLVVGYATALAWTSSVVSRSRQDVERDARSVGATYEFNRTLREYNRLWELWIATREPELQTALPDVESDLRGLMVRLQGYVGDAAERRLLGQLEEQVTAYLLATREAVEARELPLEHAVRSLRPPFERVLATSAMLRQQNERNSRASRAAEERALRGQRVVTIVCGLLLAVYLTVVAISLHRFVLRPILNLQAAVERFRMGDAVEKASGGPLFEIRVLADRFNEMTRAIARQRRDQLTFLAAVAHDLRNPLSGLKMIVQTLEREPGGATPIAFRRLDRQLDRLTRMVGDLLDATRIESGHLELRFEDFDLRAVAQAMVDLYAPTTSTHQITLNVPERPLVVRGDPLRIEQVISNLLSNAIKYSPRGGPVKVSVSATDGELEVAVSDRGIGIPPEELGNLFLPFRSRPGAPEITPGVGLGLSIVRRIIGAHGGHIDVESTPNVGSTFRVRLPLEARTGRDVEQQCPPGEPAHAAAR